MDRYSRMQYLKSIYKRYHKSNRKQKEEILNEFCKNCGYNRKYAIRILNDSNPQDKELAIRKRETVYSSITLSILKAIWEAAGWPWSVRLKALLQLWLPWAKKRFQITPETEKQLLSISTATIDRRLKPIKNRIKKRIFSTTRPGTLLKNMIPIKTHSWNIRRPGFLEVDIVAHCGSSLSGDFVNSLNTVDILTGWTETRAILGKSQFAAFSALNEIKDSLPFKLLGIDPDNDGVFINHHLHAYCKKSKIQFTRSRPYKKNDNAHIEQKNYTHVRKIFGYARYESQEACDAMNNLYRSELCCP